MSSNEDKRKKVDEAVIDDSMKCSDYGMYPCVAAREYDNMAAIGLDLEGDNKSNNEIRYALYHGYMSSRATMDTLEPATGRSFRLVLKVRFAMHIQRLKALSMLDSVPRRLEKMMNKLIHYKGVISLW